MGYQIQQYTEGEWVAVESKTIRTQFDDDEYDDTTCIIDYLLEGGYTSPLRVAADETLSEARYVILSELPGEWWGYRDYRPVRCQTDVSQENRFWPWAAFL